MRILIASGNGYAEDRTFDPYEVVAFPLPTRESREFTRVTYASHEIRLGRERGGHGFRGGYVILMRNGSGSQVVTIPQPSDEGEMIAAWLAMPEKALYCTLYTVWEAATAAHREGLQETADRYAQAFVDKRLKIRRKNGRGRVEILPIYRVEAKDDAGELVGELPGPFREADAAFAAARLAYPGAKSVSAIPL